MSKFRLSFLLLVAAAVAACDSNDTSIFATQTPTTFDVQVLHGSADAPPVNVLVNGSAVLSSFDYKTGSARLRLDEGTYTIQVDALTPGGAATVIGPVDLSFSGQRIYTIAAVGSVAAGTLEPVVLDQPRDPVSPDSARAFVLHAAPDAPVVDVYVTPPSPDLDPFAPLGSFSYKESLGPAEVAVGDYQIRVTAAGTKAPVLYDSGTVTLNAGDDLLLAAVPNTSAGSEPISLVALTGSGSAELLASGTPSRVRVVHASPDAPAVDIVADGAVTLVNNLEFPNASGFFDVAPATYNVAVVASQSQAQVIDADLTLDAGATYDVLAVDELAALDLVVGVDDYRPVATEAKLRVIHAASADAAAVVDVYLTAQGAGIDNVDPTIPGFAFKTNTGFLSIAPGEYDVSVAVGGTKSIAIGPAPVTLAAGGVYTAVARDDGMGFNLILLDDFVAP